MSFMHLIQFLYVFTHLEDYGHHHLIQLFQANFKNKIHYNSTIEHPHTNIPYEQFMDTFKEAKYFTDSLNTGIKIPQCTQ